MRRLLFALAFCVACASAPPVRTFSPMDETSVTEILAKQADAWNRGDLTGYMDGYARVDSLVFTSGSKIRKGWQATFDAYTAKYDTAPGTMGHLEFEILQVDNLGADGAVVLGRWSLTKAETPGSGVFTVILERRAEGWKIVHDHTSSDPPPSPPTAPAP
jgi:ketosteroid isomerase-like protein